VLNGRFVEIGTELKGPDGIELKGPGEPPRFFGHLN